MESLQTSFWVMILMQTIGSIDLPGSGPRRLPAPRQYLTVIIAWSVLQIAAGAGKTRAATGAGWLFVAAGLVVGPFGQKVIKLVDNTVTLITGTTPPSTTTATGTSAVTPQSFSQV